MDSLNESEIFTLPNGKNLSDPEQIRIMTAINNAHPFDNDEYKWDEMSVAELFAEIHQNNTLYCPEKKAWFIYDGARWKRDIDGLETMDRLMTFTKLMGIYCWMIQERVDRERWLTYQKFMIKLSDRRSRERIIKDAQTAARVSINRFDQNEYLVNCQNGTYNLKTCKFQPHSPSDYLTMITECKCPTTLDVVEFPRWNTFIDEISCGDKQIAEYLQRALGYSLLGRCKEECMFFAYGKTTRNGKGTLFNTIGKILGDYAKAMPAEFILESKFGGSYDRANPMLAGLKGVRFLIVSEPKAFSKLDEATIKNLTGADPITTRNLHEKEFTYIPVCKIWVQCNSLPTIIDRSVFASDRIRVTPFNAHFDESKRDTTLKSQFLTDEAKTAIFKWLIDGYGMYKKKGLNEPQAVKDATNEYERANDKIQMFIDERCEMSDEYVIKPGELYNNYKSWCKNNNLFTLSSPQFKEQISKYAKFEIYCGERRWRGLRIKVVTVELT